MIKIIAFHSYKGGTGKTTIAANFAAMLAKKGYRVFLMDNHTNQKESMQ
jgi:chromosome partitioning protein